MRDTAKRYSSAMIQIEEVFLEWPSLMAGIGILHFELDTFNLVDRLGYTPSSVKAASHPQFLQIALEISKAVVSPSQLDTVRNIMEFWIHEAMVASEWQEIPPSIPMTALEKAGGVLHGTLLKVKDTFH